MLRFLSISVNIYHTADMYTYKHTLHPNCMYVCMYVSRLKNEQRGTTKTISEIKVRNETCVGLPASKTRHRLTEWLPGEYKSPKSPPWTNEKKKKN